MYNWLLVNKQFFLVEYSNTGQILFSIGLCWNKSTFVGQAAEYNKGAGSCSQHTAGTACGALEVQIEVTTFRKNACP